MSEKPKLPHVGHHCHGGTTSGKPCTYYFDLDDMIEDDRIDGGVVMLSCPKCGLHQQVRLPTEAQLLASLPDE